MRSVQALLVYSVDQRHKVRHVARDGVAQVVSHVLDPQNQPQSSSSSSSSSTTTTNTNGAAMLSELIVKFANNETKRCTPKKCQVALYLCGVLQKIIPLLAPTVIAPVLEDIFRLVTLGNPFMTVQAMHSVRVLFTGGASAFRGGGNRYDKAREMEINIRRPLPYQVSYEDSLSTQTLPAALRPRRREFVALVAQVLDGTMKTKPHLADVDASQAYMQCIVAGVVRLCQDDPMQGFAKMATAVSTMCDYLLSTKKVVSRCADRSIRTMIACSLSLPMAVGTESRSTLLAQTMIARGSSNQMQQRKPTPLESILASVESLLSFRFKSVWNSSFAIVNVLFRVLPAPAYPLVTRLVESMDQLHASNAIADLPGVKSRMIQAMTTAMRSFGAHQVLQTLPLMLPTPDSPLMQQGAPLADAIGQCRTWLLPLMKSGVYKSKLVYFGTNFLNATQALFFQAADAERQGKPVEAKALRSLHDQLWDTFPAFCNLPVDGAEAMGPLMKKLATEFLQNPEMVGTWPAIARGVFVFVSSFMRLSDPSASVAVERGQRQSRKLLRRNRKRRNTTGDDDNDDDERKSVDEDDIDDADQDWVHSGFSDDTKTDNDKNNDSSSTNNDSQTTHAALVAFGSKAHRYLPVFANIITLSADEDRSPYMNAMRAIAMISNASKVQAMFSKVLEQILVLSRPENHEEDKASALSDVALALCPRLDQQSVKVLFETVGPQLAHDNAVFQKKSYRLLGEICSQHVQFTSQHFVEITELLNANRQSCQQTATLSRLQCLNDVLLLMSKILSEDESFRNHLSVMLAEVIVSAKAQKRRTRDLAFDILVGIGHSLLAVRGDAAGMKLSQLSQQSMQPLLMEFILMATAGLTSSEQHMCSATIVALSTLLYHFHEYLDDNVKVELMRTVALKLKGQSREIIKSVLGFFKVSCVVLDSNVVQPILPLLVEGLTYWCQDSRNHYRHKVRSIFDILVGLFGTDDMRDLVPASYTKVIDYVSKQQRRRNRKKVEAWKQRIKARQADSSGSIEDIHEDDHGEDGVESSNSAIDQMLASANASKLLRDNDDKKKKNNKSGNNNKNKKNRQQGGGGANEANLWVRDSADVDFMDSSVVRHVVASKPRNISQATAAGAAAMSAANSSSTDDGIGTDDQGRLTFSALMKDMMDDGDDDDDDEKKKSKRQLQQSGRSSKNKRKRGAMSTGDDDDDFDDNSFASSSQARGRRRGTSGKQFRSKRAGGDMLRSGQLEPHAYVPLDARALNRRHKHKAARRLHNVLSAAKQGAAAGRNQSNRKWNKKNRNQKKHKG
eukprot:TRINITY_DN65950_c3_g1_i1.p1 TRINITY_DN65950_c3_g1~~TRINITY_DN65950_c3_g1_i1.p1  ORF type:complete len:1500 (+),score=851.26 TRINITY_DN65950_c3_g1_i1:604-4500(+)